jgi:iron complex transport system substrate-binding protein
MPEPSCLRRARLASGLLAALALALAGALATPAALATAGALAATAAAPELSVTDDGGSTVRLAHPARRIVSLSPGITELLFEIGAGPQVVGVSAYSDFPAAAQGLPQVSRAQGIDLERIAALRPELIVTWGSGYSPALLGALRRLEVPVYVLETRSLESIASSMERLGLLAGAADAPQVAAAYRARLSALRQRYAGRPQVRIFYQVWNSPIMTLSGGHMASEVMRTCGARNVFEGLAPLVATVDVEAVIAARPQIVLTAESGGVDRGALDGWKRYAQLPAVAAGQLVTLDADKLDRGSARVLDATEELCMRVEAARQALR